MNESLKEENNSETLAQDEIIQEEKRHELDMKHEIQENLKGNTWIEKLQTTFNEASGKFIQE